MSLSIQIDSLKLADPVIAAFQNDATAAFSVLDALREESGIPECDILLLFTDDLVGAVQKHSRTIGDDSSAFTAERVGGMVAAKNLPQADDYSKVLIVFDATFWSNEEGPYGTARVVRLFLLAHELCHPILERARHCSGALDDVAFPSFTGNEVARSLTRILADEYRADRIADLYIRQIANAAIDGEVRPVGIGEVLAGSHQEAAFASVAQAHPLWPDVVQNYRHWGTDLSTMWARLVGNMEQTITSLIHAQAAADTIGGRTLLDEARFRSLPARTLYLGPLEPLIDGLRKQPLLAKFEETRSLDAQIVAIGEKAFLQIWAKLGLTINERPDRQWSLWVGEPAK